MSSSFSSSSPSSSASSSSSALSGKSVAAMTCSAVVGALATFVALKATAKSSTPASAPSSNGASTAAPAPAPAPAPVSEVLKDNPNPGLRRIDAADVSQFFNNYQMAQQTLEQAGAITEAVRTRGEAGFVEFSVRFGDLKSASDPYMVTKEEMEAAFNALPVSEQELLTRTAARIRHFATEQRNSIQDMRTDIVGGHGGHWVSAVDIAGCYAPGGRYPLPSSVLMTAITARVAGVKTVVVASPNPVPATLAAAYVAGADVMLRVGGAQAIAAMAYGVGDVPCCDVIVGPGNRWVTAAKQLISGVCGIDMLAGPSECLVIADESASAEVIAADLLAQAEHDVDARPILVTTSSVIADAVDAELERQLATLPTADTARVAVSRGCAVVVDTIEEAIAASDTVAPEHLEIMTEDAEGVAARCNHYGGLFIGQASAEVFGDYGIGPNHVLPTAGTGRYTGGLSVFTFLRIRTYMNITDTAEAQGIVRDAAQLARIEGLEGHARSAEKRLAK